MNKPRKYINVEFHIVADDVVCKENVEHWNSLSALQLGTGTAAKLGDGSGAPSSSAQRAKERKAKRSWGHEGVTLLGKYYNARGPEGEAYERFRRDFKRLIWITYRRE